MSITKEQKQELMTKYGKTPKDSGTTEVQVAILTARINDLSVHLGQSLKDNHSRKGLLQMVAKRKKLLKYLHSNHVERYKKIIQELDLRK